MKMKENEDKRYVYIILRLRDCLRTGMDESSLSCLTVQCSLDASNGTGTSADVSHSMDKEERSLPMCLQDNVEKRYHCQLM